MSRERQARVSGVFLEVFPGVRGPTLVIDDPLTARALPGAASWSRYAVDDAPGGAWPEPGPYEVCALRLPRAKPALELALHAAASVLEPGGTLWVYGANDEGIKSAAKRLRGLFAGVTTASYKRHCRVLRATRTEEPARTPLSAWREDAEITLEGRTLPWVRLPGVFAKGKLDEATAALLAHLPELEGGSRILDLACGGGVIARVLCERASEAEVWMCDADAVSLEAARLNAPQAQAFLGDGFAALPDGACFQQIVSNPPIHVGVDRDYGFVREMIRRAPTYLEPGGALRFVIQRQAPVGPWLEAAFGAAEMVWEGRRDRIWSATLV